MNIAISIIIGILIFPFILGAVLEIVILIMELLAWYVGLCMDVMNWMRRKFTKG